MTAPALVVSALPQYEIGGVLGEGAMGVVYAATHRALGRHVAVKQLPATMATNPEMSGRFDHEARLLAALDHPHIVPVYDYVRAPAVNALVMERLDGGTVWDRFHQAGLDLEQSCAIGLAMLAGLHAAHRAGVLHLDVKPKNLLFTTAGALKVADFGIAQVISEGATLVTTGGEVLGTPAYIAPEQALGNRLTPAADVYGAGTVLYELLAGSLPYVRDGDALAMVRRHVYEDPVPIGDRVPAPLAAVIMRSLVRDPAQRYADAEAFAVALAGAATEALGPGWLERSGVPVQLAPKVAIAAATVRTDPAETRTVRLPLIRPHELVSTRTIGLDDLHGAPLVPARTVLREPRSPLAPALVAAAAVVVLIFLALAWPATPDRANPLGLAVGGAPATAPVTADLTSEIEVTGAKVPAGSGPLAATLTLTAAGAPLGTSTATTTGVTAGGWKATFEPPPYARWVAGGAVTGEVELRRGGQIVGAQQFTVEPDQAPLLSVMGAGSILLLLFALAYVESVVRSLRRGQRRRTGPVLAAGIGLLFGAAIWLLVSVLLRQEPAVGVGIGCALLGAVATGATAVAFSRTRA